MFLPSYKTFKSSFSLRGGKRPENEGPSVFLAGLSARLALWAGLQAQLYSHFLGFQLTIWFNSLLPSNTQASYIANTDLDFGPLLGLGLRDRILPHLPHLDSAQLWTNLQQATLLGLKMLGALWCPRSPMGPRMAPEPKTLAACLFHDFLDTVQFNG